MTCLLGHLAFLW